MEKKIVSIWIGSFLTKNALKEYVKVKYNKKGSFSRFGLDFKIEHADEDFQEIAWKEKTNGII